MTERTTIRRSPDDDAISITSTLSEEFFSGEEFLVERVLAEKKDARNRVIYLIFWAGYLEAQSTWEPSTNIQDPAILEAWEERKVEEARGAKPTFDLAAFDARAAEIERAKAERHQRRKAKKRGLGIPVSSSEGSDVEGHDSELINSDSSEAVERNELPGDESIPTRKAGQRLRRRSDVVLTRDSSPEPSIRTPSIPLDSLKLAYSLLEDESSDSSDLDRDPLVGNKKKAQRKALDAIRLKRLVPNVPKASRDAVQPAAESAVQLAAKVRNSFAPQSAALPIGVRRHAEGPVQGQSRVQTEAQAAPKPTSTRIPKSNKRPEEHPLRTRSTSAIQRPSVNSSAMRGRGATRGRHLARRNVFEQREPPKKRRTLIESVSNPNKEQRLFGSWHIRRKAELAGRGVADAAPDVTALGGLFSPSDPASFQPLRPDILRRRSSIGTLQASGDLLLPADPPCTSTSSRPAYIQDRHGDNAICYFWYFSECSKGFDCKFLHSEDPTLPIVPPPGMLASSVAEQEATRTSALPFSRRRSTNEICFYWNRDGNCSKGADCHFVHDKFAGLPVAPDPSSVRAESYRNLNKTCKYWLKGYCNKGENCTFLHSASSQNLPAHSASELGVQNSTSHMSHDSDPMLSERKDTEFLDKRSRNETTGLNRLEYPADSDLATFTPPHLSNEDIHHHHSRLDPETPASEKTDTLGAMAKNTKLSLEEYRNNTNRIKEVIFGHDRPQSILLDFGEIGAKQPWVQTFSARPVFRFNHICTASDFQTLYDDNQGAILWGGNLTANPADGVAVNKLNKFGLHLRIYCGGLISISAEFTILIYPAMEEWKTVASYSGFSQEDRVKYLIFQPSVKINQLNPVKGVAPAPVKKILAKHSHGLRYRQLVHWEKEQHHFYLMFPSQAKSTAAFFASWLRACDPRCKVYSSKTEGSWCFFAGSPDIKVGAVFFHESVIPSIPELPSLNRLLVTADKNMFSFWCIDDSGNRYPFFPPVQTPTLGKMSITRIFPHGHAIFLTPSFLVAEPERARVLISWFREKLKKATPGTWKLVCAYDIRSYLLELANEKALERDQFMEQNHHKPAKDAMAGKRGLSYQTCEVRYKCHDIISGIIRDYTANRLSDPCKSDQLVDVDSPIVFAAESINPDSEQDLITWFAGWSVMHLDKFRKFTVVGTNRSSYESAVRMRGLMDRGKMAHFKPSASGLLKNVASVLIPRPAADNASVSLNADTKRAPLVSYDSPAKTSVVSGSSSLAASPTKGTDSAPRRPANTGVAEMDVSSDSDVAIVSQFRGVDPETTPDLLLFCSTTGCNLRIAQEYLSNAGNNFSRAVNLYNIHNRSSSTDRLDVEAQLVGLIDSVKAEQDRQLPRLVTGTVGGYPKESILSTNSSGSAISPQGDPHTVSPTCQLSPFSPPSFNSSAEDPKSPNFAGFRIKGMAKMTTGPPSARTKTISDDENRSRRGSPQSGIREFTKKRRTDEVVSAATSRDTSRRGSYSTPTVLSPLAGEMDIDSPQHEANKTAPADEPMTSGGLSDTTGAEFRYWCTTAWYRGLVAEGRAWEHLYVESWDKCFKHIGLQ